MHGLTYSCRYRWYNIYRSLKYTLPKCKEVRYIFNADVNIRNIALCAASKTKMFTPDKGVEMC